MSGEPSPPASPVPDADQLASSHSLQRLRDLLVMQGGLMRSLVIEAVPSFAADGAEEGSPARLAAAGPRAEGRQADYELLVETIYEGYLLHYGTPRVVRSNDADLGLLAGDDLYALGLARLVELGDVEAVAELADVISLSALAHGSGSSELADAVWRAGAVAVGWGSSAAHERAKALVRDGSTEALEAMLSVDGS